MSLRRVPALLLGVLILGPGCSCAVQPGVDAGPNAAVLAFAALPATVDCATTADADASPGFQIEVEVLLQDGEDAGFTTVSVTNSRGDIAPGEGTFGGDGRATVIISVSADEAAPGAENTLTATAIDGDGVPITASESLRVICPSDAPLPECRFTSLAEGDRLTTSPVAVSVSCLGGDPDSAAQQSLLAAGTVVVTATPASGAPPESVAIDLVGGSGTAELELTDDGAATLDLTLADPAGLFDAPVSDTLSVVVDLGFSATDILVVDAGADGILNIADHGGLESSAAVASDVTVSFEEDVSGGAFTATTALGTCTTAPGLPVSGTTATLVGCPLPQGVSNVVVTGTNSAGSALRSLGATLSIDVDTLAPLVAFSQPSANQVLTSADDAGLGGAFAATVVLASSDNGALVSLRDNAGVAVVVTIVDNAASAALPLGQGARTLTADITDPAGNAGTGASLTVTVDSEAPVLVLVAADVSASDDIGGDGSDGIQVDVTVTPTGLSAGRTITITSDVTGVIGSCLSQGDGVEVPCRVSYLAGATHAVTASASDEVGNRATSNTAIVSP